MKQRSKIIATFFYPADWKPEEREKWWQVHQTVEQARQAGKKIVFTSGVFDLFHKEHQKFLEKARASGNFLLVGVESDFRVRDMKGPNRPVDNQEKRLQNVIDSGVVDEAAIFPEAFSLPEHFRAIMALIRPHIFAISSHSPYQENKRLLTELYGGELKTVHDHNPDVSTTALLEDQAGLYNG